MFDDLKILLARASPLRAGDVLAGGAAATYEERVAAQYAWAVVPMRDLLHEALVPYEQDQGDAVDYRHPRRGGARARGPLHGGVVARLGGVRGGQCGGGAAALVLRLTPEMVAAVSKLLRNQELTAVARRMEVVTCFRNNAGAARALGYPPAAPAMTPAASGMADAAGYF